MSKSHVEREKTEKDARIVRSEEARAQEDKGKRQESEERDEGDGFTE